MAAVPLDAAVTIWLRAYLREDVFDQVILFRNQKYIFFANDKQCASMFGILPMDETGKWIN